MGKREFWRYASIGLFVGIIAGLCVAAGMLAVFYAVGVWRP
jgi:uncharacterized membrane-anchored protein YhcB (DUF1043 family)